MGACLPQADLLERIYNESNWIVPCIADFNGSAVVAELATVPLLRYLDGQ